MLTNNINKKRSVTFLELILTIAIIGIMAGAMVAMMGSFGYRQRLENSAIKLLGDLRQTQQFARVQRNSYKYYGLRFYSGLGEEGDRAGYKIVRYNPPVGVEPLDFTPPVDFNDVRVIKSSDSNDNSGEGPEYLEDTFFDKGVGIDANSDFQVNLASGKLHSIVFTPEGSATSNGQDLLTDTNDEIRFNLGGRIKTITIIPLTGYVKIE